MTYTQQKQLEQNALAPCNCDQALELQSKLDRISSIIELAESFQEKINPSLIKSIIGDI